MRERTKATVRLGSLVENYKLIRNAQQENCRLMIVLKADAYGHGAVQCAKALEAAGADFFAVACLSEALELRNGGIRSDILIFGWTSVEEINIVEKYNLIQTIIDMNYYKMVTEQVKSMGIKLRVHIKLDSGMSRIGWTCYGDEFEKSIEQVVQIYEAPNLNVEGIYTHFSSLYESDKESCEYSDLQYDRFKMFVDKLKKNGIEPGICHCNNSAGTLNNPEYSMDMCRVGTALFGILSKKVLRESWNLKPVMSWKASIAMIKEVSSNIPVSYSRMAITSRPTKLAIITVGYADGYSRKLSNIGVVSIRGHLCPIVGRICMDMMMADVTDYSDIAAGDEVMLFGKDETNDISCELLWRKISTGPSDITCSLTSRVPREYIY